MTFLTFFPAKFDIYFLKQHAKLKRLLYIFPSCFSYQFSWRGHLSKLDKINAWIKKDEVMIFENSTKWFILTRAVSIACRNVSLLSSFSILCWSCIRIHFVPQKRLLVQPERKKDEERMLNSSKTWLSSYGNWSEFLGSSLRKTITSFFLIYSPKQIIITIRNLMLKITSFIQCRVYETRTHATCLVPCQETCF